MNTQCPPAQSLRRYAIGDIDDSTGEQIEQHLAACSTCEDSVARFDTAEDSLMRHLPLAAGEGPPDSAARPGWVERLRLGPPAEGVPDDVPPDRNGETSPLAEFSAYEPLRVLGRGGMGVVYRARHRQLNRNVALKVLNPRLMATREARRRFEREIQVLGSLQHPGIVMATDAGRIGEAAYLVMELIDGIDLARIVRQTGPLAVAEACEAARQMAEALAAAHQAGTVHRDVKPSNAMVDRAGRVKLLDFGLAHLAVLSTESLETSLGRLLGTLDYMAPEQAGADQPLDGRADLYGLGATLFYLLTGRPPHGTHTRRSLLDQLRALAAAESPRVSSLRADVPPELDEFIARLLSRDPEERPDNARSVAEALSTWAGGDLAARVAEVEAASGPEEPSAEDSAEARRSLSELLGFAAAQNSRVSTDPAENAVVSKAAPQRTFRRWGWLALSAATVAAAVWAVIILLETPQGTLRIDSEVDDVRIELVDEQNRTRELEIERGENETTLRAGQYRVRLAGRHDGVVIDRDVVTLRRGAEVVARIQRQRDAAAGIAADVRPAREPLYQGQPESEWQRLFETETAAVAKLDAARALLVIASDFPDAAQINRILDIGEEIVRAGAGEKDLVFAFESGSHPALWARHWSPNETGLYEAYQRFLTESNAAVRELPAETLAQVLPDTIIEHDVSRASFAASLLRHAALPTIHSDQAAARTVLRKLDVPLSDTDRSAVCLLVRSRYAAHASAEQQRAMTASLETLASQLQQAPAEAALVAAMRDELINLAGSTPSAWPRGLRKSMAMLVLEDVIRERSDPSAQLPFRELARNSRSPYDPRAIDEIRRKLEPFLDVWLLVVNEYLERHGGDPGDRRLQLAVSTIEPVLQVYSDSDHWPAEQTAALLSDYLSDYYAGQPGETLDQPVADLLPAPAAMLLTQVIRVRGEIPGFIRSGRPRPESVIRRLHQFRMLLSGEIDIGDAPREFDTLIGLLDEAPHDVVKLCVSEHKLPVGTQFILRGGYVPLTPAELLYVTSSLKGDRANRSGPPADPLLLLAVLTDLAGESEAQDQRIASLLASTTSDVVLRKHLANLLSSRLQMRVHARRMLREMAAKARSQELKDAIAYLDPALVRLDEGGAGASSAANQPAEPLYQGKSESAWQRLFEAETAPLARLQAAQALFALAAARSPEEQLDRLLEVGGVLMEGAFGDRQLHAVWSSLSDHGIVGPARWPFAEDKELRAAFRDTIVLAARQTNRLPAQKVAERLSRAIVGPQPHESAFAARLMRASEVWSHIEKDDAALRIALETLDVLVETTDQSANAHFLRAGLHDAAPAAQGAEIVADLNALAAGLRDAPAAESPYEMKTVWLDIAPTVPLSTELGATLILQDLPARLWVHFRATWFNRELPYSEASARHVREQANYFLPAWIATVNDYLQGHPDDSPSEQFAAIVQSLDYALRLYFTEDDWDVEMTAALLTDRLRPYYATAADKLTDKAADDLLPVTPALLLTQIVRITGKVPEFIRQGQPQPAAVRERLAHLKRVLESGPGRKQFYRDDVDELEALIEVAPYHAIRLALGPNNFDEDPPDNLAPISVDELLYAISSERVRESRHGSDQLPPTDPLLLLTVLADLAGESAEQDERIARILTEPHPSRMLKRHLDDILSGPWKMKSVVRRLLAQIAERSESEELTDAVRKLDPGAVRAEVPSNRTAQ